MLKRKKKGTWPLIVGIIAFLILLGIYLVKFIPVVQQSALGSGIDSVKITFPSWYDTLTSVMGFLSVLALGIVFFIVYWSNKQRQQGGF